MTAAILEIRDGIATGPLHQPRKTDEGGRLNESDYPLSWRALCDVRGYVYEREALRSMGHTSECFECALVRVKDDQPRGQKGLYVPRYETDEERRAARLRTYKSYYQRKKQRRAA